MRRREAIAGLCAAVLQPSRPHAQPRIPRIGVLWHAGSAEEERIPLAALRQGLQDLGYIDGRNIVLENRYPNEEPERFRSLAVELAELKVDVLVAVTRPAAVAAQRATTIIPTVFVVVPDPVGTGLVKNLARPGGNITGLSSMALELTAKRLEILKETLPHLAYAGLLVNMGDPDSAMRYVRAARAAADPVGVTIEPLEVRSAGDFEDAFATLTRKRLQGIVLTQDGLFYAEQRRLASLALTHRIPVVAYWKEMAESGLLMSYGPSTSAIFRRVGFFVDKILKGERPGDLPVEQPTKFELFINEKTARSIGITVPPSILARADEVIE
jgi:putative tryptophan/tyrosine transport system substrate-binding protein